MILSSVIATREALCSEVFFEEPSPLPISCIELSGASLSLIYTELVNM